MFEVKRMIFIGDSITEEGRFDDPEGIGYGYVRLIRDFLATDYPEKNIEVMNRGVGGNRIVDLVPRWKEDVLDLEPDYVSISIGINDVWRQLDQPELEQVYPEQFEAIYRQLINEVQTETKAKIYLMEPTIHQENLDSEGNQLLKPYVEVIRNLGRETGIIVVPTHQAFTALIEKGLKGLTTDGVHMTSKGDMVIAKTWVKTFIDSQKF